MEGLKKSSAKMLPAGLTILFTSRAGIGDMAILAKEATTNQGFQSIVLRNKESAYFIFSMGFLIKHYALRKAAGSTFLEISGKQLGKMPIRLPSLTEQARIGEFFRVLDGLVAAAKKKADLLKAKKRYYLQAIFNQQLQLKGYDQPWQQHKLGELFKERTERSDQGELISVTLANGVVLASSLERKDNSSDDKSNYKRVEIGDIAYNTMRMWQGASGVSSYSGILSPAYTVLIPRGDVFPPFFAQMFKLEKMLHIFQSYSQGLTSDTWNLKYPLLAEIRVKIPFLEEQERIGQLFTACDHYIAAIEGRIEVLRKQKAFYLQQLFV